MARKFIISENRFIMGNVELHMDLIPKKQPAQAYGYGLQINRTKDENFKVLGGGRWQTDNEKKVLYLWGESVDFGYAQPEAIKRAIESEDTFLSASMEGWDVMHSPIISHSSELPDLNSFTKLTVV